jgi:hypothetical protein
VLPLFGVKFTVADGSDQRVDMIVGGRLDDHGRNLSAMGTDHPNVCYHARFVWISRLGHSYHRPLPPILEPLPTPRAAGQPPNPPLVPADPDWENSQIWEQPPKSEAEPEPEPEPDSGKDPPPF